MKVYFHKIRSMIWWRDRLMEIIKLQNIINLNHLHYNAKSRKDNIFSKISLPTIFLIDIHTSFLSIENAYRQQSNPFKKLSDMSKNENQLKKYLSQKT